MNICMYTPAPAGGHALYTRELLSGLAEVGRGRGVSVCLATSVDLAPGHRTPAYPIHAILPRLRHREEFRSIPAWFGSRLCHYHRRERDFLRWVAERPDLDLIHFQEYVPWLAARNFRTLRRRGIAVVMTIHNIFNHRYYNKLHEVAIDSWARASWRECDALIVHSEGLREDLASFLGAGHPPIHMTPHGVWEVPGPPAEATGGGRDGPLLFFGVIRPNKGLHVLLQAMGRIPHLRLIAAGSPEADGYTRQIRGAIGRLPPGQVEFIDRFVDDDRVADLFGRCSLVVLPYTSFASQSGVLHLALAHGRPVVATDVGALGESVRGWGIGEVVPPDDERALAEAIEAALDPHRYREAVDAIGRVRAGLSWARTAELTIHVYQTVLGDEQVDRGSEESCPLGPRSLRRPAPRPRLDGGVAVVARATPAPATTATRSGWPVASRVERRPASRRQNADKTSLTDIADAH